jgi:hypothetical protein
MPHLAERDSSATVIQPAGISSSTPKLIITYIAYFAAVSQADLQADLQVDLHAIQEVQSVVDFAMASRLHSSAQ